MVDFFLLGTLRILDAGRRVAVPPDRLAELLAYVALHAREPLPRRRVAFALDPDVTEPRALAALRKRLFRLRRERPDLFALLTVDSRTIGWTAEREIRIDVHRFLDLAAQAADVPERGDEALALYTGPLLPELDVEWVLQSRAPLRQRFLALLASRVSALEERRAYQAAIPLARRWLDEEPTDERALRALMRLHALAGDPEGARGVFERGATRLEAEFDLSPAPETRALRDALPPAAPDRAATPTAPFVGRADSWRRLLGLWRESRRGGARLVVLRGEAGIGKSRLADEFLGWARRQGVVGALGRCYPAERGVGLTPVAEWLRAPALRDAPATLATRYRTELARLVPELALGADESPPGAITEGWEQQRLFGAIGRALDAHAPLLLVLDDLQWCDDQSLAFMSWLLRERTLPLLLVATLRDLALELDPSRRDLLDEWRRRGAIEEVALGALTAGESAELVRETLRVESIAHLPTDVERLHHESGGNPLFLLELLRSGVATSEQLPPQIMAVVNHRLDRLSAGARRLAERAAVAGYDFDVPLLAGLGDTSEAEVVAELDELWRARLIVERERRGYDFAHERLRAATLSRLGPARRRSLHGRIADRLEAIHEGRADEIAARVAAHHAGAGRADRAAVAYEHAARVAAARFAHRDAIAHARRARALLPNDHDAHLRLLTLIGSSEQLRADYPAAVDSFRRALARAPVGAAWIEVAARLLRVLSLLEADDEMWALVERARAVAPPVSEKESRARLDFDLELADALYLRARSDELETLLDEIEAEVEALGDSRQILHFLNSRKQSRMRHERYRHSEQSVALSRRILEEAHSRGEGQLWSQFGLGFTLLWAERDALEEASARLALVLEEAERIGNVRLQNQALCYLTVAFRLRGDLDAARALVRQHLPIAEREGYVYYVGAAHANHAWVAWRDGDEVTLRSALAIALARFDVCPSYPFHWLARLPELAVAARDNDLERAARAAVPLLEPRQQRLPPALTNALEAICAAPTAEAVEHAVELAREYRYL